MRKCTYCQEIIREQNLSTLSVVEKKVMEMWNGVHIFLDLIRWKPHSFKSSHFMYTEHVNGTKKWIVCRMLRFIRSQTKSEKPGKITCRKSFLKKKVFLANSVCTTNEPSVYGSDHYAHNTCQLDIVGFEKNLLLLRCRRQQA